MYELAILIGVIGFFLVLGARKRLTALQLELATYGDHLRRLTDDVERLRARQPDAPPAPSAPTPAAAAVSEPPAPHDVPDMTPAPTAPDAATPAPAATTAAGASLEERLGTRWAVRVGGLALALGGVLLVRYSIEQGFFGPGVRVMFGALFSAVLIAAGERFRRSERRLPVEVVPAAHVPSILTAAGTASAFGTVYAAHALYGFIGPAAAFVLLGIIGIATMLAAALHGPALAGFGLAGSLVVPLLVSSQSPNPWSLVLYLAVVAAAAYALARLRRWLWLASAVVLGASLWGLVLLLQLPLTAEATSAWVSALFVHVALQLALAAAFMAIEPHLATPDDAAAPDWIAAAALAVLTMLAVFALAAARFDAQWSLFAVAVMTILAVTAWRSAPAAAAAVLAGAVALGAIMLWPGLRAPPDPRLLSPDVAEVLRLPDNVSAFLTFAGLTTLAVGALATLRLWRGQALPLPTAGLYAMAAVVPVLLALVLAYLRVTQFDRSISFALFAVFLAALFYLTADRFGKIAAGAGTAVTRLAIGAFASGTAAAMTLAFVMLLDRGYLTVAFAVTALTTARFAVADRIPMLRYVVAALGFIVLGRLVWDPRIMGADVGSWPILNWLLLGYGAPAFAFLGAGHILKREGDDIAVRICDALGVLFAGLLVFFQIRHALNGGDPLANTSGHIEQGLLALMSLGFAYVLMRLDLGRANPVFHIASLIFGVVSAVFIVFGLGIVENPLLSSDPVRGAPVFSSLVLAYLFPGLAAVLLARASRGVRPAWYVTGAGVLAIALVFGYVTLEVRHIFQGAQITIWRSTSAAEVWSYSAAWLALGLIFLGYGIARGSGEARLASVALVVLAVLKVFLYDLTGITGLWRALSVICLGAVLVGIGLVYQKLIFARPAAPAPAPASE